MADTKISDDPSVSDLTGGEYIPIVQNGENKKVTVSDLVSDRDLGTPTELHLDNATDAANKRFVTDDEKSAIATVQDGSYISGRIHNAAAKTDLDDLDELALVDSEASYILKKFTLSGFKTWIRNYLKGEENFTWWDATESKLKDGSGNVITTGGGGGGGEDGVNAYQYTAWASDNAGTGFTLAQSATKNWRAEIHTTSPLSPPVLGDFASAVWEMQHDYGYYAYASDENGADFTLVDDLLLDFTAELRSTTYIAPENRTVDKFDNLWRLRTGADGTNGAQGDKPGIPIIWQTDENNTQPASGVWKINTPKTFLRCSNFNRYGTDISSMFDVMKAGDTLIFVSNSNTGLSIMIWNVAAAPVSQTSPWTGRYISGSILYGTKPSVNSEPLAVLWISGANKVTWIDNGDGTFNLAFPDGTPITSVRAVFALTGKTISGVSNIPALTTLSDGAGLVVHKDNFGGTIKNVMGVECKVDRTNTKLIPYGAQDIFYGWFGAKGTLSSGTAVYRTSGAGSFQGAGYFNIGTDPILPGGLITGPADIELWLGLFSQNSAATNPYTVKVRLGADLTTPANNPVIYEGDSNSANNTNQWPRPLIHVQSDNTSVLTNNWSTIGGPGTSSNIILKDITGLNFAVDQRLSIELSSLGSASQVNLMHFCFRWLR